MSATVKKIAIQQLALFLVLLFVGLTILPLSVYTVGRTLFGAYAGAGFSDFYGALHSAFRSGEPAVWLLMLSPYLVWQLLTLTVFAFRHAGKSDN